MKKLIKILCVTWLAPVGFPVSADIYSDPGSLLPPVQTWSGKSESLIVGPNDPWVTPAERTGLSVTPGYDQTMAWLAKLVAAAPELEMVVIGRSLQGRDIQMVIASADQAFTADTMQASNKPLLIAHAGIHAGEIDGKDAGRVVGLDRWCPVFKRLW